MIDYSKLQSIPWLQQVPRTLTPEVEKVLNDRVAHPAGRCTPEIGIGPVRAAAPRGVPTLFT